ncbi:hypothetical protein [Curtobacterium sp. 458]|uniref:hypothetical protein n=1 Tax=Curtobacterium sp. 458 TaxID=3050069 RepID=UPI0025B2EF3B|nr:hypothetical protein [Curtobacterium sp. 458]WJY01641.1 hypothetical protein QPJ90_08050 [Curtobacterium sp. 458]
MTGAATRTSALAIFGGVVATAAAWIALGLPFACVGALATITYAASMPSVIGTTRVAQGAAPDHREVRKWRKEHPGATITEAIAAVSER